MTRRLIETAVAGGLLCRWVTGDEAYGGDPHLAAALRGTGSATVDEPDLLLEY